MKWQPMFWGKNKEKENFICWSLTFSTLFTKAADNKLWIYNKIFMGKEYDIFIQRSQYKWNVNLYCLWKIRKLLR